MSGNALSVLVVDDTVTYRRIVSDIVNSFDFAEATATAPTGEIALKKLEQSSFDLVLLDVDMPGMGGLETLKCIVRDFPDVTVVMVSGITVHATSTTIKCMNAGALEFVCKPTGDSPEDNNRRLLLSLKAVVGGVWRKKQMFRQDSAEVVSPRKKAPPKPLVVTPHQAEKPYVAVRPHAVLGRFDLVAIGVSTGGPKALTHVIPNLPGDFPLPLVMVQHMPEHFTKALADDLDRRSAIDVREASEGDELRPGLLLIAPGSRHMVVRHEDKKCFVSINDDPPENSCRPAVDVLFRSLAESSMRCKALTLIMTGMGCDGRKGVELLRNQGGYCLTQSEQTCVVYGMPQAIDEVGLSDESLNLDDIAPRMVELAVKGIGR
jgi:two-component system, chemotaxis family, protein-glutamate methylesterase/glutaminase